MEYLIIILTYLNIFLLSEKISSKLFLYSHNIIIQTLVITNFILLLYITSVYLFFLNINLQYFLYLLTLSSLISSYLLRRDIIKFLKFINLNILKKNKLIFILIFLYFLTITIPSYDQDSLRYHLNVGKKINNNSFYQNTWLDYLGVGPHEFINAIFLKINFLNVTSTINFLFLLIFIFVCSYIGKKYKNGADINNSIILLSSPFLISQIVSQKLFFFPSFITALSIFYLFNEKKINLNLRIIILIFLANMFCFAIKPTFAPFFFIIFLMCFFSLKNNKKLIFLLFSVLSFFIIYGPLIYFKYRIYDDPFLPFFSVNPLNQLWFNDYVSFVRTTTLDSAEMIQNSIYKYFAYFYKIFLPLNYKDYFKIFGLSFLFIFTINFSKNYKLIFLFFIFLFSILVIGNFQNRWFLPLLIFICFYADLKKIFIFKKILIIQSLSNIIILVPLAIISMLISIKILDKEIFLNKFNNSYSIIKKINLEYPNQRIFSSHNNFYFFDNVIPIYHSNYVTKFDKNYYSNNKETKLILWEGSRNLDKDNGLDKFLEKNNLCQKVKKIDTYYYRNNRWIILKNSTEISLYKFDC